MRIRMDAIERPDLNAQNAIFDLYTDSSDDENNDENEEGVFGTAPPKDMTPPIEKVLQTKWPGAVIDYLDLPDNG